MNYLARVRRTFVEEGIPEKIKTGGLRINFSENAQEILIFSLYH